jgi:hypothetical protein
LKKGRLDVGASCLLHWLLFNDVALPSVQRCRTAMLHSCGFFMLSSCFVLCQECRRYRRGVRCFVFLHAFFMLCVVPGKKHNNNKHATPPVHACSTLTMPPAHRRQLRPTGAERPGLTKQKQDRRHLARRRIAARERQLTAGGGRPPPTGRAPPPPPAPPPAASPRRAAATRTTATCAPTRSSRRTRSR